MGAEPDERFRLDYETAFGRYVAQGGEDNLAVAYELGRQAVTRAISLLELSHTHHGALLGAIRRAPDAVEACLSAGAEFLSESLAAFEITQRGFREMHGTERQA